MIALFLAMLVATPPAFAVSAPVGDNRPVAMQRRRRLPMPEGRRSAVDDDGRSVARPGEVVSYGADPRQAADLYVPSPRPGVGARPPLAIFIHGGGWRIGDRSRVAEKPTWFARHGWAFASLGYRLLPDAPVEMQARDLADGIRALRADAARLGFDPDRILLIGHSAGAHLAALLSTQDALLGADLAAIRGTILLDGAGYDVPRQMVDAGPLAARLYDAAFGQDAARQGALSPINHVGGADVGDWLIIHAADRADSAAQSTGMATALRGAGRAVQLLAIDGTHRQINVEFGRAGYAGNAAAEAIMARVAAAR